MIWVRSRTAVTLAVRLTERARSQPRPGYRGSSRNRGSEQAYGIAAASSMMSTERSTRRCPRRPTSTMSGTSHPRTGGLAHGVGQGLEVVAAGPQRIRVGLQPDDLPATRDGHPLAVDLAEVVAVGLGVGGQGTQDRGRIRVDVRQRRDSRPRTRRLRATTNWAHRGNLLRPADIADHPRLQWGSVSCPPRSACRPRVRPRVSPPAPGCPGPRAPSGR